MLAFHSFIHCLRSPLPPSPLLHFLHLPTPLPHSPSSSSSSFPFFLLHFPPTLILPPPLPHLPKPLPNKKHKSKGGVKQDLPSHQTPPILLLFHNHLLRRALLVLHRRRTLVIPSLLRRVASLLWIPSAAVGLLWVLRPASAAVVALVCHCGGWVIWLGGGGKMGVGERRRRKRRRLSARRESCGLERRLVRWQRVALIVCCVAIAG